MPSDTLSLTVGTGLGVSVLAGIISGVCFVMGYRRIHKKRETKWHCAVCNKYFRSPEFILEGIGFVICSNCKKKVCKSTCSMINPHCLWVCRTCNESTANWIYGAFKAVEPITKVFCGNMGLDQKLSDELEDDRNDGEEKKKEQVRAFIERLVNNLLGDDIDDASINEIYSDRKYRRMLEKYHRDLSSILTDLGTTLQISLIHLPAVGESPCSAHSALKRIIQKIIREANDLPKLKNIDQSDSSNQENRTYEDLLSTAIINKIISASQNNISLTSSRTNSVCTHRSSSLSRKTQHKDYILGEESPHNKKKWRHDTDTASVSSLEEWVHSDSSLGSTKYVDRVSLTIKQRIEEVSSSESEAEYGDNDDVDHDNFKSAFQNTEPNWFLQKRQFRGMSCSPVPVSMLVPDSTKEAKVLIGDKEIDDTSDLSDVPSDFEENSLPSMEVKNHLIDSKKLIGGKNSMIDFYSSNFSDDEISGDSGVKECKYIDEVDSELISTSNKNETKFVTDASISSDGSNTERDTEYTEKYGTLPRKISISPKEDESTGSPLCDKTEQDFSEHMNDLKKETEDENIPNFTGVYSKREKEKWSHAVELEYNPYSKENIEKRMKCRNSVNSLFGSDYYIRQASLPSGTKKTEEKTLHFTDEADTFQSEEHPVNEITTIGIKHNPPVRLQNDKLVLMARPFNVAELSKQKAQSKSSNSLKKSTKGYDLGLHFASEFSSDSEVSLVNCYDVTESVIYKKLSAENDEEIQTAEKYFDFESLETSLNLEAEKEEGNEEPIVEIIKQDIPKETLQSSKNNNKLEPIDFVDNKTESGESHITTTPYVITKRSDNTLIKKIYSDPSVRSFALSRRKKLPSTIEVKDFEKKRCLNREQSSEILKPFLMKQHSLDNRQISKKQQKERTYFQSSKSMGEHISKQKTQLEKQPLVIEETKIKSCVSMTNFSKQNEGNEIHINNHQTIISANNSKSNSDRDAFEEIDKLKKQKLVANRLKVFSKSTLDLSSIEGMDKVITFSKIDKDEILYFRNKNFETLSEIQNRDRPSSVRDIRKKFEKYDADAKIENPILHSLTGRSLSKQFKEKLRNFDGDIPSLSQIHSLSLTNLEVEENTR